MRRSQDALLAAYLDGVGELQPDERREVEAWLRDDPAAPAEADATRALLGQLRELPAIGDEPKWSELEHAIAAAVNASAPPMRRSRWSRWAMPIVGLTMATAALVLWLRHPSSTTTTTARIAPSIPTHVAAPSATMHVVPAVPTVTTPAPAAPAANTVWLDGQAVDLDDIEDPMAVLDDLVGDEMAAAAADSEQNELLPSSDLGWVDGLDNAAVDRLDGWLKRAKG